MYRCCSKAQYYHCNYNTVSLTFYNIIINGIGIHDNVVTYLFDYGIHFCAFRILKFAIKTKPIHFALTKNLIAIAISVVVIRLDTYSVY